MGRGTVEEGAGKRDETMPTTKAKMTTMLSGHGAAYCRQTIPLVGLSLSGFHFQPLFLLFLKIMVISFVSLRDCFFSRVHATL